ncbi:formimidoylglutamase [Postechiella marina]|uniref:Formimidoylglutamase n=1 Tax=Postechiella marina TaxID=943941 RepID=A0ABP8CE10_9FLAO
MENFFKNLNVQYCTTDKALWSVRASNSKLEPQYWHQHITISNLNKIEKNSCIEFGIIGYSCEEGVKRNQGRIGTKEAPNTIRKSLSKLPIHFEAKRITDFGNISCLDNDMEACQNGLLKTISLLIKKKVFPIVLGGGHDLAYGHFNGIKNALKHKVKNKIGIINFDAHFDLRQIEDRPNSGTPFNQIFLDTSKDKQVVNYFVIGIQQQSNTKMLFNIAKENRVQFVPNLECTMSKKHLKNIKKNLKTFINQNDYIYISIDMDGFSSAYAPGVSASSSLGFSPFFFFNILEFILKSNKVISCDIAEVNPVFDADNKTSKLAAKIVDFIVQNYK